MKKKQIPTNAENIDRRNFIKYAAVGATALSAVGSGIMLPSGVANAADNENETSFTPVTQAQMPPKMKRHAGPFTVITVGTGCPEPVIGRSGPCTLVQYKGNYFMVDVGDGTTKRLCEAGIQVSAINNVLFTHHHADHNEGYVKWLINSWMVGRKKLDLVGPPKTKELQEMILKFYGEDLKYRSTLQGLSLDAIYNANIQELEGSKNFNLAGVKITTAELTHTMYNLGYRFDVDGKSIVVSGDTSFDEDLITLSKNADILVMDSGMVPNKGMVGASRPLKPGQKPPKHMPPKNIDKTSVKPHPGPGEVAKMSIAANVKKLVLTHFPPFDVDEAATIKGIKNAGFKGEVIIGKDLMEIVA